MKRTPMLPALWLAGCAAIPDFSPCAGLTPAMPGPAARVARETLGRTTGAGF